MAPVARACLAFGPWLLGVAGDHCLALVPSQCWVAIFRQSSGSWQVSSASTEPKEEEDKREELESETSLLLH